MRRFGPLVCVVFLASCLVGTRAEAAPENHIDIPHISEAPPLSDNLNEPLWQQAAKVIMPRNLRDRSLADQSTTIYLMTDGTYLYVGFEAKQRTAVQASQHTNDVGQGTDDQVTVYLWPEGATGFNYGFTANPIGTHYQYSTENTSYAPTWTSTGRIVPGGYVVMMRIPLHALRGGNGKPWRIQFERYVRATLDDFVWSYDAAEENASSVLYAGYLDGLQAKNAARPQARFGLYALDALRSRAGGGSTSRMGLDASIPIAAKASFVAALHPDYSNVELDQQTIAPTAFQRFFNEVRPFFTQLANQYNNFTCIGCPGIQELYTPAVPTPRDAYAVEGKQGLLGFAGYETVGIGRIDSAEALNYQSKNLKDNLNVQRVSVDGSDVCGPLAGIASLTCFGVPAVHDDNMLYGYSHDSLKGLFEYVNFGTNSGTFVSDPGTAIRRDAGVGTYDKDSFFGGSIRSLGAQYAPLDSFIQQTDIAGYDVNADRTWYRKKTDWLTRVIGYLNLDEYHNAAGQLDLTDAQAAIGLTFQHRIHIRLQTGSDYTRLADNNFVPINQNGVNLLLDYNTATPTTISYFTGRYGPARLDSWSRSSTWQLGPRGTLTLEADNNVQWMDKGAPRNMLWLERASYAYQNSKSSSLALGVRRIIGSVPLLEFPSSAARPAFFRHCDPAFNPCVDQWNVSGAFYKRLAHDELYLVYGDASQLTTQPQLILKIIHYFGAEKGT